MLLIFSIDSGNWEFKTLIIENSILNNKRTFQFLFDRQKPYVAETLDNILLLLFTVLQAKENIIVRFHVTEAYKYV